MEKEFIERLEDEIAQQTRNGRDEIYIEADDLRKLGYHIDKNKQGRTFINVNILREYIKRYKFKDNLKVKPIKQETFKDVENDIKRIERSKVDDSWDSISK